MIYYSATTTRLPSCAIGNPDSVAIMRQSAIKVSHQKYSNIVFVVLDYHAIILNLFIIHREVQKNNHPRTKNIIHYGNHQSIASIVSTWDNMNSVAHSKICAFTIYVRAKGTRTIIAEISTRFIVAINWCCTAQRPALAKKINSRESTNRSNITYLWK